MPDAYDDLFADYDEDLLDSQEEEEDSESEDYGAGRRVRRRLNPPSEVDELDDTDEENQGDASYREDFESEGSDDGSIDNVDLGLGQRRARNLVHEYGSRPGTAGVPAANQTNQTIIWARSSPEQLERERRAAAAAAAATAAGPSRARRHVPNLGEDSDEERREPFIARTGRGGAWRSVPSEQRQQLRELATGPSGTRNGSAAGSAGGGSAAPAVGGRARRTSVVDLTADSDEEDVVFMNAVPGAQQRPRHLRRERIERAGEPGRPVGAGFDQAMRDLNNTLDERRRQTQDILEQEVARRRGVLSPPPAPEPPRAGRIGLGGALLNRRGHQVRYQATRPGYHAHQAHAPAAAQVGPAELGRENNEPAGNGWQVPGGDRMENALRMMRRFMGWAPYNALGHNFGQFGQGGNGRPQVLDVQAIIAGIPKPTIPDPLPGFISNFDLDSVHPIEIDDSENVVKTKKKAKLSCFICHNRLKLSSSYTSDDDRVWTLRCGHMIDQRCLHTLSTPITPKELSAVAPPFVILPVLGAPEPKTAKRKVKGKVAKEMPREYEWTCPAKGCGMAHKSVKMPEAEEWVQRAGEGALQVYM